MLVGVGFCKIKVESNFLLVLNIKCTKFHQDRSKTVDLHPNYINRHSVVPQLSGVPELADQIETVYSLMVMKVKKRLEKYSGRNSFLVMN
jgi:hypothetical protein